MDPLSQGALGAVAAQSLSSNSSNKIFAFTVIGALAGMAPDLDIFIRSSEDPLLALEFHRQFTHSLIFIPIGGALCALILWSLFFRKRLALSQAIIAGIAGWATHGLLDSCTSYGTLLLWPFSQARIAWNNIGIVDPIPTFVWCFGAWLAFKINRPRIAQMSLFLGISYLLLGVIQRERATKIQNSLISARGHIAQRQTVKPTVFQLFAWRSIYEFQGTYFIDAFHVGFTKTKIYEGTSLKKFQFEHIAKTQDLLQSTSGQDILRFSKFSDHWIALHPELPNVIGDVRFSMLPHQNLPLWGVILDPNNLNQHLPFENFRNPKAHDVKILKAIVLGQDLPQKTDMPPQNR